MNLRQRAPKLALLAVLVVSAIPVLRTVPRERTLTLDLGATSTSVQRLDVSYAFADEPEPLGGFTLAYPDGAPRMAQHVVSLPSGTYGFDVSLQARAPTATLTTQHVRVTLGPDDTSFKLKLAP